MIVIEVIAGVLALAAIGYLLLALLKAERYTIDTGYLRLYLSQLRKKLEPEPGTPRYLVTEAGMGYRFVPEGRRPE